MAKKTGNDLDKKLAKELASLFWAQYGDEESSSVIAREDSLEMRAPYDDPDEPFGIGYMLFTPKTIYFDAAKNVIRPAKKKVEDGKITPAYILIADYSDAKDMLVIWSLDDRSEA